LKPENLLINENNILKLCDFGWSVKLKSDKRTTFCGTVEYMAPEIIKKQQYDETIDVWSLGVLLYELVHSYSPFCSEDCDYRKIGNNIIQSEFEFKEGLSEDYKDLIQKILIKDSEQRIKIEEIYQHPFITKHINTIYREVNSFNNTYNNTLIDYNNLNYKLNGKTKIKDLKNKSLMNYMNTEYNNIGINKKTGDIIYNRNEKNKNKGCFYKKVSPNNNKIKEQNKDYRIKYKNYDNSRQQDNDFENNTDSNYIFESIPTEPEPKILPDSKKCKEIKKVNNDIFIKKNENNSPNIKKGENNLLLLNT
jgi:serine/threonine protein kinase